MSLKKSDKIIAIIGVLILVIAGAAIVIYAINYEETDEPIETTTTAYNIVWTEVTEEMSPKVFDVSKAEPLTTTFSVDAKPGSVLTSVSFKIAWEDHNTYGLKDNKGLDTLTVTINLEDEKISKPYEGTGSAENVTMGTFSINEKPNIDEVEAVDIDEALQIVKDNHSEMNSATFNIEASIEIGEPAWKFLKANKDKGNDFSLIITYTYYYPEIPLEDNIQ
jgi:hypothetical protein